MGDLDQPRVALMASGDIKSGGGGSTADRVARDALEGKVNFQIGVVICNNPEGTVGVYDRFEEINRHYRLKGDDRIDVVTINGQLYPDDEPSNPGRPVPRGQTDRESEKVCETLQKRDIDFVAMVGWMRIIRGKFVEDWGWKPEYGQADPTHNGIYHPNARISNNHPAILPHTADTHGIGAHKTALDLYRAGKLSYSAFIIHLAAAGVDSGAVIFQKPVKIFPSDRPSRLSARAQRVEKKWTARALDEHLILRREHLRAAA